MDAKGTPLGEDTPNQESPDATMESHPALQPRITTVPVTPGVREGTGMTSYDETPGFPSSSSGGSRPTSSSYFPTQPHRADSPVEALKAARGPADLLRRLSLTGPKPRVPQGDPRDTYPGLGLSGRIINAAICIPYSLEYRKGADWTLKPRRGTSALFDCFNYLSSASVWQNIVVAWTGEIKETEEPITPPETPPDTATTEGIPALNVYSAPIPLDVSSHQKPSQPVEGLRISQADRDRLERQLMRQSDGKVVPVWLMEETEEHPGEGCFKNQSRWRRFPEHEIYTLFHYKQHEPTDGRKERKWWADYFLMNQKFADRILEVYKPGDVVWIHDYHLLLLPSLLRARIPNIYIGFYLHIPFPSSEFLRCLSRRKEILEGVLGANMVGFQNYSYSRHFSSCCTRILGFDSSSAGVDAYGAHVAVDVFPIGVDATKVEKLAFGDPIVQEKMAAIKELYAGKKIIVGRDRLDTVRGIAQKLMAFEKFLELYPEWREKVVLIQVTSPTSIEEEKEDGANKISNKIADLVSRINGLYGSLSFTPVQHYPQYLSKEEYFALLRVADVGLITSVRDGMNTTSLEYVICQKESHGPLILSEFSGTAGTLSSAIHINPWDHRGVADSINLALTMNPAQKKAHHERLYRHAATHTVQNWADKYLSRLLTNLSSFDQSSATPALDRTKLLAQYRKAKRRLFMFDYDGTLTPIVKDPASAIPSDRVVRNLKTLASDPKNSVWIISGRDQAFLEEWLGHITELGFSAEHGSFIRHPKTDDWENLTETADMGWQKDVMDVFQHYTERTQGSFIERKRCALTWHYRRADPEYGAYQARECQKELEATVAKKWDVEVMTGKANLEVRPTFVNKGEIAKRLVKEAYGDEGPEFVLCLGDDSTDEDMFRALRSWKPDAPFVFSVTVGASSKQTIASWHVLEPADVIAAVALLNGAAEAQDLGVPAAVEGKLPEVVEGLE